MNLMHLLVTLEILVRLKSYSKTAIIKTAKLKQTHKNQKQPSSYFAKTSVLLFQEQLFKKLALLLLDLFHISYGTRFFYIRNTFIRNLRLKKALKIRNS